MIRISKRAIEKLKESHQSGKKDLYRLFISSIA
jgi:hypothetical protein